MNKYADILYLPRHISRTHKHMSNLDRAAQFAPFAALSGHEEAIIEMARITNQKIILDESQKEIINRKLQYIHNRLSQQEHIKITYFVADEKKKGGSYKSKDGKIRKIDEIEKILIFDDLTKIKIQDILNIESEIFERELMI